MRQWGRHDHTQEVYDMWQVALGILQKEGARLCLIVTWRTVTRTRSNEVVLYCSLYSSTIVATDIVGFAAHVRLLETVVALCSWSPTAEHATPERRGGQTSM
eukprot:COSAG06_NODE_4489_length_4208_cov_40.282064_4_plen_102_part_00